MMSEQITAVLVSANESNPLHMLSIYYDGLEDEIVSILKCHSSMDLEKELLLRPCDDCPGLYAYHNDSPEKNTQPNIRATRLSMACGLFANRFYRDVLLLRTGRTNLSIDDVKVACCVSADLRASIQVELKNGTESIIYIPDWIQNASKDNYHDGAVLARLAKVMNQGGEIEDESSSEGSSDEEQSTVVDKRSENKPCKTREFIAKTPLCLHCRRPASTLCPDCEGAYFCDPPRTCRDDGWSHRCLCSTWKLYTQRRAELSNFPLGSWHKELVSRPFQLSTFPYEDFLVAKLGINKDSTLWWRTEMDGWSGGKSASAKSVDVSARRSYASGFYPISEIPPDCRPTLEEISIADLERTLQGFLRLQSWDEYYRLRGIPMTSPVALLLTFPLTLYHAIVEYGQVPCTVAQMLKRRLRIHIVGAEKETNFLDLFREVAYLLPEDVKIELVFVVRYDMLPPSLRNDKNAFTIDLTYNLCVELVSGTYGDSLDPRFDCGSGMPDMVVAFNAGLYAYESWRSVIAFLDNNQGVVGVFTDYNEFSGVQCASLGGSGSRESLCMNPFRQPLAMPVYSMNLPQFSNGFFYVFNSQELE